MNLKYIYKNRHISYKCFLPNNSNTMKKSAITIIIKNATIKTFLFFWKILTLGMFDIKIANPHKVHSKHTCVIPEIIKITEEV